MAFSITSDRSFTISSNKKYFICRYFVIINCMMAFVVRFPFWLFKAQVQDYLKQVDEFSKAIIARNKHQDFDLDLVEQFLSIYHHGIPTMKRSFYKFLFCFGLCVAMMIGILAFLIKYFELTFEDLSLPNQTLTEWPSILKTLLSPYLAGVLQKIKKKFPENGLCTLQVSDSGGTMRDKHFTCRINHYAFYEITTVVLMLFYVVGGIIVVINIVSLLLKCAFPNLRR